MIGDLIPFDNGYWNLLLLLLQCMEFIFSPSITLGATIFLAHIIHEHHSLFLELYPHLHLRPKHHFMLHYSRAIMKLGPLVHFWAMRFESKHGFFKRVSQITCNFKNICKTMAFRHQMMQCYAFLSDSVFAQNTEVGPDQCAFLATLGGFRDIQSGLEGLPPQTEVFVPAWVKVRGTEYRPGMTVLLSYRPDGEPEFGLMQTIVAINTVIKLIVQRWDMVGFERHFFAYEVQPTECVEAIDVTHLLDYHPLHAMHSLKEADDNLYISLRYRVF